MVLMRKIGVRTQKRAMIATMVCSVVLVTLLGTLAGANAVIAPIVIPLVAAVGITPSALAVIFQGAGQTGLFLSPFSPPMVTLMSITGLSYPRLLLCAGLPVSIVMWVGTFLIANKVQKETQGTENFGPDGEAAAENFQMDPATAAPHRLCGHYGSDGDLWDRHQWRRILRDPGDDRGCDHHRSVCQNARWHHL